MFGSNAGGDHRSAYDPIKAQRVFFSGAPAPWGSGPLAARVATVVSFKPPPQDVLAGRHDAMLRAWFASMPNDRRIGWSYIHEPEDQVYVPPVYGRSAPLRIRAHPADLEGAGRDEVQCARPPCPHVVHPCRSRTNWRDFYPDNDANLTNGSPYVDVLAWDLYWGTTDDSKISPEGLFQRFGAGSKRDIFAVNRLTGDPIAIAEIGYDHDPTRVTVPQGRREDVPGIGGLRLLRRRGTTR